MAVAHRQTIGGWRKGAQVICCLLPLLAAQTEVLPGLLALFATAEGSHTTIVGVCGGEFRVVLSHEGRRCPDGSLPRQHRHGVASGLVCAFAVDPAGPTDHHAQFGLGLESNTPEREFRAPARVADGDGVLCCIHSRPAVAAAWGLGVQHSACHAVLPLVRKVELLI